MVNVLFRYSDGNEVVCRSIKKISYNSGNGKGFTHIEEDQLLTTYFHVTSKDFFLSSDSACYAVTGNNLLFIQISKS